ncbi:hypothetical protein D3C73_1281240 [compost metagenome]
MASCSADIVEVAIVEVGTDIGLDVRTARGDQLAAAVDDCNHVRFRRLEALHVRIHRDRTELPLQRGLDPVHRQVGLGRGDIRIVNRLNQQALAEAGAGIGLVLLQVGAIGLGIAAVDHAQGNVMAVGNAGGATATYGGGEDAVQRRDRGRCRGNRAAG